MMKDPEAWHRHWHETNNAKVAALVADGVAGATRKYPNGSREEVDDDQLRWFFQRQYKPAEKRTQSDRQTSADAYLHEGVMGCMRGARADERRRLVRVLSNGLKVLLGDEFTSVLYDLAIENDINIGSD